MGRHKDMKTATQRESGRRLRWLVLAAVLVTACSWLPARIADLAPGGGPVAGLPQGSATPTPFLPATPTVAPSAPEALPPTPIPTVDPSRPWGAFAAPSEASAIEIPPPAEPIAFEPNVVNVLLLGSDARPYEGGYRTDVMMVVSLDPEAGTASVFSIPRDLYVYIPGYRMERVNVADPRGGPSLAAETILYNFGIPIHHYARMSFAGFTRLVDSLGGITVEVTGYLNDECGGVWRQYGPGNYNMDGFTALCYVRMRKNSSDFDRLRRQQEVLQAIFRKVLTLDGLRRVPDLYQQFAALVETDIGLDRALQLLPLAVHLSSSSENIHRLTVDPSMAIAWRVPASGAAVLLPDRPKIEAMLHATLGS